MNNYYNFIPPFHRELKSMFYNTTYVGSKSNKSIKHIFTDPLHNNFRDVFIDIADYRVINAMAKPSIALYGYFINNPQQFQHDPNNIVAWMLRYSANTLLSLNNINNKTDGYRSLPNKFVTRHKDFLLKELEIDARIVARKAYDIEIQRKGSNLEFSMIK